MLVSGRVEVTEHVSKCWLTFSDFGGPQGVDLQYQSPVQHCKRTTKKKQRHMVVATGYLVFSAGRFI